MVYGHTTTGYTVGQKMHLFVFNNSVNLRSILTIFRAWNRHEFSTESETELPTYHVSDETRYNYYIV